MVDFTMDDGTGRDLIEAQRIAGGDANQLAMALAARLVRVNGKPVLYEDFLDWPLPDVMRAVAEVNRRLGNVIFPDVTG